MNQAANAYANAIYSSMADADGVAVTFDHTFIVKGTRIIPVSELGGDAARPQRGRR